MERLTRKQLRALLECIKECYSICDLETFSQRVVSKLSKIASKEIILPNVANPRRERNVYLPHPHVAYTPSENKIFAQRVREHPTIIHHAKTSDNPHGQLLRLGLHNKFYPRSGVKYRIALRPIKQAAVNCKIKNLAVHDKLLVRLVSLHLNQAYHNAQTFTHMQQKLSLVDQALYRLNLGPIFLTPDGKIRLATTWAVGQVTSYLGPQCLRKNRLPEPLWTLVKQQEVAQGNRCDSRTQSTHCAETLGADLPEDRR